MKRELIITGFLFGLISCTGKSGRDVKAPAAATPSISGANNEGADQSLDQGLTPSESPEVPPNQAPSESTPAKPEFAIPTNAIYLSPEGDDENGTGTLDKPYRTFKTAFSVAKDGQTIVARGGTYRESLSLSKKLHLQPYKDEKVWIKGSEVIPSSSFKKEGELWTLDWDRILPFANVDGTDGCSPEYCLSEKFPEANHLEAIYRDGMPFKQVLDLAQLIPGQDKFFIDRSRKKLYLGSDPREGTLEATVHVLGLTVGKEAEGIKVRGLNFAHYGRRALTILADNVTLEHNVVTWNGAVGTAVYGKNAIIRHNVFSYNGRKGLGGYGAHGTLVARNLFTHNNYENFSLAWDASGMKFGATNQLVCRDNTAIDNNGIALWLDVHSSDAVFVRNHASRNAGGIFFELSNRGVLASNVLIKNGVGLGVYDATHADIYNNTLVDNGNSIKLVDGGRKNEKTLEFNDGLTFETAGNVIRNNIFAYTENKKGPIIKQEFWKGTDCKSYANKEAMVQSLDSNVYLRTEGKPIDIAHWILNTGLDSCRVSYQSWDAMKSAIHHESEGLFLDDVKPAEFFSHPEAGDFALANLNKLQGKVYPIPEAVWAKIKSGLSREQAAAFEKRQGERPGAL